MAFNSIKIVGNGTAQTAIANTNIIESVVHSLLAYNTGSNAAGFSISVDGATVITERLEAISSYTLPIKLNVPVGTSMEVTADVGVDLVISYYSQSIDAAASTTLLQNTVVEGVELITGVKDSGISAIGSHVNQGIQSLDSVIVSGSSSLTGIIGSGTTSLDNIISTGTTTLSGILSEVEAHVATIPEGTINDSIETNVDTWSSQHIKKRFNRLSLLGF